LRRFVPHLHTFSTLRSAGLLHPQYRFIPFRFLCVIQEPIYSITHFVTLSAVEGRSTAFQPYYVCRPLFFQRWRSSHSHRAWLRWHFALNQGTPRRKSGAIVIIFPAVSRSQYFSPLRKLRSVPVLR
jgi:hypothetical protein